MAMFMVKPWYNTGLKIVPWSTGTDEQIVAMVEAADRGEIDLTDYWHIGDERQVTLSKGTSSAQDVIFVLMDTNHYELYDSVLDKNGNTRNTCSFVVGQKDCLSSKRVLNSDSSITYASSWNGCTTRTWCNNDYKNSVPSTLIPIFKYFKVKTLSSSESSNVTISKDLFSLFAEKEIFGSYYFSGRAEANVLDQIEYYKTESNMIKKQGINGSRCDSYWLRSPRYQSYQWACVSTYNSGKMVKSAQTVNSANGIAPFGVI